MTAARVLLPVPAAAAVSGGDDDGHDLKTFLVVLLFLFLFLFPLMEATEPSVCEYFEAVGKGLATVFTEVSLAACF